MIPLVEEFVEWEGLVPGFQVFLRLRRDGTIQG